MRIIANTLRALAQILDPKETVEMQRTSTFEPTPLFLELTK